MRLVSGSIRIVTGLAIIGMSMYTYISNKEALSGTSDVTVFIFGQAITAAPQNIFIGICLAGLVGVMIELLGVWTILRKAKPPAK